MNSSSRITILISALLLLVKGFFLSILPNYRRRKEIKEIVSNLQNMKSNGQFSRAIDMNICFFRSVDSIFRFLPWLVFSMPKIRKEVDNLVEVVDLPFAEWQKKGYIGLSNIEKHRFTRIMINDFANELCRLILSLQRFGPNNAPLVILDLGCGGGFLCHEIMNRNRLYPIVCIGIDNTPANIEIINGRFKPPHDRGELTFKAIKKFNDNTIENLLQETKRLGKSTFAVYQGDFFGLNKLISPGKIDMIFHSRVIHHLGMDDRYLLDEICRKLSFVTVELEDIYSRLMPLLAALMTWGVDRYNLALMNGAVLSCIRDPGESHLHGYVRKVLPNSYVKLILGEDSHCQKSYQADLNAILTDGFEFITEVTE